MNQKFRDYLDENFELVEASGGRELRVAGQCPFCHKDRHNLKLFVNVKTGKGLCHHCGQGFNPVQFVMEHSGCTYHEAARALYGSGEASSYIKDEEPVTESHVWFPEVTRLSQEARDYLDYRQIGKALVEHFSLMSCEKNTRVGDKIAMTANRIIIPVRDVDGKVAAWQGRDITGRARPKYLFPDHFKGRDYLFNIHAIPEGAAYLIICEGVFDVFGWWQAGFQNVVATFGKKISKEQLALISSKTPKMLFIAWDSDAVWQKYDFCEDNADTLDMRIIDLGGKDADEMTRAELLGAFKSARAYDWSAKILACL